MNSKTESPPDENRIEAIEENLFEYIRYFAKHENNNYFEDENILQFVSNIDIPSMQSNSVYKIRYKNLENKIDEIIKPYKESGKPLFITAGPSTSQYDLKGLFKKHGIIHVQCQKGMALDLKELDSQINIPSKLQIKEIGNDEELKDWLKIYTIGFDYSQSLGKFIFNQYRKVFLSKNIQARHYLAYYKGKPVATSSLFIKGKTAGLYNIITLPEARRKGIAKAMTLTPLIHGKESGCSTAILHGTDMGVYVYDRIGFKEYCTFDLFMKLHGKSTITFPAAYVWNKFKSLLRRSFIPI